MHGSGGKFGKLSTSAEKPGAAATSYNPPVAEDQGKEEEKFDFTSEGEGYISLSEARVLAMRTAMETPGDYGTQYQGVAMVFEVVESGEDDDYYTVVLSVRPQGNFDGTPGQEQLVVGKEGTIALRQVLSTPIQTSASPAGTARTGDGFPILPVAIGVVIIGIIAAVGAMAVIMGSNGGGGRTTQLVIPADSKTPVYTQIPSALVTPTETLTPTEPTVSKKTLKEGIQPGQIITPTLAPSTSTPSIKPTEKPEDDPPHVKSFDTIYVMVLDTVMLDQAGYDFRGESITFQIGNLEAEETAIWESGAITYLDLSASSGSSRKLADPGRDRLTNFNVGVLAAPLQQNLPPNMFSGSVTIDGRGVPKGTTVTAWISGKLVAESEVILRRSSSRLGATGSLFSPVDDYLNVIWSWSNKSQNWEFYSPDNEHFAINTYTDPKSTDIIWVNVSGDVEFQSHLLTTGLNLIALDFSPASGNMNDENVPTTGQAFSDLIETENLYRVWHFDNVEKSWRFWDPREAFQFANTLTGIRQFEIVHVLLNFDQSFQGTMPLFAGTNQIIFR